MITDWLGTVSQSILALRPYSLAALAREMFPLIVMQLMTKSTPGRLQPLDVGGDVGVERCELQVVVDDVDAVLLQPLTKVEQALDELDTP